MARTGKFKCTRCDRTFAMAAHLGRHMSTLHAPRGKRTAPAATMRRPALADWASPVLDRLRACRDELAAQRAALDAQVASLDQALAALGGSVASVKVRRGGRRSPAFRAGTLPAYIRQVMHAYRGPMAVKEVAAAVLKAGYKSRNKELPKTVGKYLAAMPSVQKIGRGVYRAK